MAKAKKPTKKNAGHKVGDKGIYLRCKPAPRDNFNLWRNAAGTQGAPVMPTMSTFGPSQTIGHPETAINMISKSLTQLREAGGLAIVMVTIATNDKLLDLLAGCNSILMIDKTNPTDRLCRKYNRISAGVHRKAMPGKVFNRLVQRNGVDYGLIDGVRQVGNFYGTIRKLINETRPLMHNKAFIGLLPDEKGKLKPAFAYWGSMNWSWNALTSFEAVEYTEDPAKAQYLYDLAAHTWSFSEGLFDISHGLTPQFEWQKGAPKFSKPNFCPDCGGTDYAPYWWQPKGEPYASRILRCRDCNQLVPY